MAENTGGRQSFVIDVDNDELKKGAKEAADNLKSIGDKAVAEGARLDNAYKKAFEGISKYGISSKTELEKAIEAQKSSIKGLEDYYHKVNALQYSTKTPNNPDESWLKAKQKSIKLTQEAKLELERERNTLELFEKTYKKVIEAQEKSNAEQKPEKVATYRTQITQLTNEMAKLENEGKKETEQYGQLQQKLTEVGTAYRRATQEKKLLTTGGSIFTGLMSGMQGLSGAFTAGQGAMSLFVKDNERLAAIQTKLQAAMSITIGLQSVSNTLHETSAFRIHTVTKITELWRAAQVKLNTQLGISAAMSKLLMVSGIGLLMTGIAALVIWFQKLKKEQEETARLNKIVADSMKEAASEGAKAAKKETADLELLYKASQDESRSKKERIKAIDELKKQYPDYFKNLSNEKILAGEAAGAYDNLTKALIAAAKARAAADRIGENSLKILDAEEKKAEIESKKANMEAEKVKAEAEAIDLRKSMPEESSLFISSTIRAISSKIEEYSNSINDLNKEISSIEEANKKLAETININDLLFDPNPKKQTAESAKHHDYSEQIEREKQEMTRLYKDLEFSVEQARIDAKDEGAKKILAQNELNHQKEVEQITRQREDLLRQLQDNAKTEWLSANPKKKEEDWHKSDDFKKVVLSADDTKYFDDLLKYAEEKQGKYTKELIDKYQDYASQRLSIEKKFNDDIALLINQRSKAEADGNTFAVSKFNQAISKATSDKGKELISFDFNILKESPEYVRAFEDLKNTSSETLNSLLSKLEQAKSAAASTLDPKDLREYTSTIQSIMDELNERNPFEALHNAKLELAKADEELATAKANLDKAISGTPVLKNIKLDASTGKLVREYISLEDATKDYNKALDNQKKKHNAVEKTTKELMKSVSKLSDSMEELGKAVGGEVGEIISLISNITNVTLTSMQAVDVVKRTTESAMATVESASVILMVISAVIQIAMKIANLLGGESDTEKYEKAKETYESYINILDKIIEKHLELAETLAGKNAMAAYEKAIELIEKESEAARILGKQYLNSGASKGFLGIGSSASKGREQVDNMTREGWEQAAKALDMSVKKFKELMGGRMTGLFDLSLEQLQMLSENAPLFLAQLDSDTQNYFQQIIDSANQASEVWEQKMSDFTLLDKDTLRDDFLDLLTDMDISSKDFAENFEEYMKKAILNSMLKESYAGKLNEWRKEFAKSLEDADMSSEEYAKLKKEYQEIFEQMLKERDSLAEMFDWTSADSAREASSKGFESMSQDSANELNGRFASLQALTYSINENTKILAANSGRMLEHLAGIESNTKYCENLEDINRNIASMKSGIDDMNLKGMIIRK